ncbi:MAG: insulinase family protein [Bacteroidia bacterium]|nr:insulinase family protein [Bacteroidia bacterium]
MKKFFSLLAFVLGLFFSSNVGAQTPLPIDTAYVIGRLENGLTYYIRHNEYPKDRAFFYIAQRVGASLEEDAQNGLAHFLEHMAFNGTKNYPGKGIIDYMERQGVKFGANINAYTSFDETVYNLDNVPTTNPSVIDSALLVLHDWSGFISLEEKEIDAERGVILEEWRTGRTAARRVAMNHRRNTMTGTPYEVRDIIGDSAVIKHFSYDDIRNYYHKWYRPDLQGIVVIGDVDPKAVEQKIIEMWKDIPAQANPAERKFFPLNLNGKEPIISIETDPELTSSRIELAYRRQAMPREYRNYQEIYLQTLILNLTVNVIDLRFDELTSKADCPATAAGSYDHFSTPTNSEFAFVIIPKNGKFSESYDLLLDEVEKLRRWGVTTSELEIAKQSLLKRAEDAHKSSATCQSSTYVNGCVRSFIDGTDLMSQQTEYELLKQLLPFVTKDLVNQILPAVLAENVVICESASSTEESILSAEELKARLAAVATKELAKYEEVSYDKPLVANTPVAGKIVAEEKSIYESTKLTLSNGIEVYILHTDYAADQISFQAISRGGASLLDPKDAMYVDYNDYFISTYGLGEFSATELTKVLSGKSVNISTSTQVYGETVTGSCSKGDIETLLQSIYLKFGEPRRDVDAFESTRAMLRNSLVNVVKNPKYALQEAVTTMMFPNNAYATILKPEHLDALTLDKTIEIYKSRFSNPADFKFIFVGDIDIETVKPLIATWLGSLATSEVRETPKDINLVPQTGVHANSFEKEMETTTATSWTLYGGELKSYDRHFIIAADMLNEILRMRYLETIREDEGGSYGVSTVFNYDDEVRYSYYYMIQFDTDPTRIDNLYPIIEREIKKIAEEGPDPAQLKKVIDNKVNNLATMKKRNPYWMAHIQAYLKLGIDKTQNEEELYLNMSTDDIKAIAAKLLSDGNRLNVTLLPKK